MKEESLTVECTDCRTLIQVPASAKFVTCPKCGYRWKLDAAEMIEGFKKLMKAAYGDKPEKPENN